MGENVVVKIKTCQIDSKGERDDMELITEGKLYKKNDATYVVYEESEISGMKGTTTTLKILNNCVVMKRFGNSNSELTFEKGRRSKTKYKTAYGDLSMETVTKSVDINIDENLKSLNVNINYDLNITGLFEGKNIIDIKIN